MKLRNKTAYLLLGSNLGDRANFLAQARAGLTKTGELLTVSPIYETAAWGLADQPAYLNQVVALHTWLPPNYLLLQCQAIEQRARRTRTERWGSRTLDVDVLLIDDQLVNTLRLTVPHPRLTERRFALQPLADIAPDLTVPGTGLTVAELLAQCPDPLAVERWQEAT